MSGTESLLPRARARYRLLLEQLREEVVEDAPRGGWQDQVAEKLGISQTLVSKYAQGTREPSLATIDEACQRLGIQPDFFFSPDLDAPHYRNHRGRRPEVADQDVPFWEEFRANYDRFEDLDAADVATMKSFDVKGRRGLKIRSWTDWVILAEWVLGRKPSRRFEESGH